MRLSEEVEMDVQDGTILIHAPHRPRSGWDEAFEKMARAGDDKMLDSQTPSTRWDTEEWEWK
jgi:antitoxin MazE